MAEEQEQFEAMLLALSSPDGALRARAEAALSRTKESNGAWLLAALAEAAATSSRPEVADAGLRQLYALLNEGRPTQLLADKQLLQSVQQQLIAAVLRARDPKAQQLACRCVRALEARLRESGSDWKGLWETLTSVIGDSKQEAANRGAAAKVFTEVTNLVANTVLSEWHDALSKALAAAIGEQRHDVASAASCAAMHLVQVVSRPEVDPYLSRCLPPTFGLLDRLSKAKQSDLLTEVANGMSSAVEEEPGGLKPYVAQLPLLSGIAKVEGLSPAARGAMVQLIIKFCEAFPKALRKNPGTPAALFDLLFGMLLDAEYPATWGDSYPVEDGDEEDDPESEAIDTAAPALDALATAFGPAVVAPLVHKAVLANIRSSDWRRRNASVVVVMYVLEACAELCRPYLGIILDMIVPLTQDSSPFVRSSSVNFLAQCAKDLSPDLQRDHHARVIPCLIARLDDSVPRIRGLAAASIDDVFEVFTADDEADPEQASLRETLQQYLEPLVTSLLRLEADAPQACVKIGACNALGTVAGSMLWRARPFVGAIMPRFQALLAGGGGGERATTTESEKDATGLRCAALRAASVLASAVGIEHFRPYAPALCEFLGAQIQRGCPPNDRRTRYTLRGWNCMFACLKGESKPYLAQVMPELILAAAAPCKPEEFPDVLDEPEVANGDTCLRLEGEDGRCRMVRVPAAEIELKGLALRVLFTACQELRDSDILSTYVEELAQVAMQSLSFKVSADVRHSAALLLEEVVKLYVRHHPAQMAKVVQHVVPAVLQEMDGELEFSILMLEWGVVRALLEAAPGCIQDVEVLRIIAQLGANVVDYYAYIAALGNTDEDDDDDNDDDAEDGNEVSLAGTADYGLLLSFSQCCGAALRTLPGFAALFVGRLLQPTLVICSSEEGTHAALHTLAELIDTRAPEVGPALGPIVASMVSDLQSGSPAQASVYALGVALEHYRDDYAALLTPVAPVVLQALSEYLDKEDKDKEDEDHDQETEAAVVTNAVQTILKVLEYYPQLPYDAKAMWKRISRHLPLHGDNPEAVAVHAKLATWLKAKREEGGPATNCPPKTRATMVQRMLTATDDCLSPETRSILSSLI